MALAGAAALLGMLIMPLGTGVRAAAGPPHVMLVLMENTSYELVVGNSAMPFVNAQVAANGSVSTTDVGHPSLPNYLGLSSGSVYNMPADTTPQDATYPGPQLTDELAGAGIAWKAYIEDMPQACDLSDQFGPANYDVNHNPFMYYDTVRNNPAQCNRDVPYGQLASDLGSGSAPPFIWVTPNLLHDMHNGSPVQGDAFLQGLVTQVKASSWWTGGSRIVITWDEGETTEQVLTLVIGSAHGTTAVGGNQFGTLRGLEEAYGVGLLGHSADANAGDILPLLTGAALPPPPPPPPAKPSPSPSPSTSPSPTHFAADDYVRGVYGTDSSASRVDKIAAAGFNTVMTDPYRQSLDPLAARGLKGIVWLGAWVNKPVCGFERDDATIASQIRPIAGHAEILAYYLGDEPRVSECPQAPTLFKQRSALVHSLDPGSLTFTVIQAFENGTNNDYAPWSGVVDILGFDVYPCAKASPSSCDLGNIDSAITAIGKARITRYWAIVQDFQDCYYRLPTALEVRSQFDRWSQSGMSGYLVFSWNYQSADKSCVGTNLESHSDNIAALTYENSRTFMPRPATASLPPTRTSLLGRLSAAVFAGGLANLIAAFALLCLAALGAALVVRRLR